jgi:aldehyde dehydrogenase (NAD+)
MAEAAVYPIDQPVQTDQYQDIFNRQMRHQYVLARTTAAVRIEKLQRLHDTLLGNRKAMEAALWQDLHKSPTETVISELGFVCGEIRHTIQNLRSWMHPQHVPTPMVAFGARSEIRYEPKGVCLILSPWNFPFNLTFNPLVAAVAAGNCVIVKPSEFAPASAALMKKIVQECFPPEEVSLFEGDASVAKALMELPFHHVFFTGSPQIGKSVMQAAAQHLSSVTLELGGKSPVIIDESADLDVAAAKVAWVKCMNMGQLCTAPDYVLVPERLHDRFVEKVADCIKRYYGETADARRQSPDLCRLIHERHFDRVKNLLDDAVQQGGQVAAGGTTVREERFIDPTVLTHIPDTAKIWEEEIFGPLLPVRTYQTLEEAVGYVNGKPKPLALYIFSLNNKNTEYLLSETRSGGVTVNDCSTHFYNLELPFGGANNSGIGRCHGEFGFLEFSHMRGVLRQARLFPTTNLLLPPYGSRLAKVVLEALARWL